MQFLFPLFLFALVFIAIPIIIHFFNFRRFKTVYFSNVDFLKNIKKESKKKVRLKQLFILIARILTICCLVFAFTQPFLPSTNKLQNSPNQLVAIYLDNSFSMNAKADNGQLLDIARSKAADIASEYRPGTKFMLITNELHPKHQHSFNREQFIQQVSEVTTSPIVIPLSRVYNRIKESTANIESSTSRNFYLLSDFQRGITDIQNFKTDTSLWTYFIPLIPNTANNLYIDSCWFETPSRKLNQEEELFVKIVNRSDQDYQNLPLKFYLNDSLKALANFNISAQGETKAILKFSNFKSGFQYGKVELTDYPVTYDNTFYLSYHVLPSLKALVIYENADEGLNYLKALFADDSYVGLDVMSSNNVQISRLVEYNAIFLLNNKELGSGIINELEKVVGNGSSLLFLPHLDGDVENYNQLLAKFNANLIMGIDSTKQAIGNIAYGHEIYADAFAKKEDNIALPEINGHFKYTKATRISENNLLWFKNRDKVLGSTPYKDGFIHTFSFPLNQQNSGFATDILFVPTMYGLVLNSIPQQNISHIIGKDHYILLNQINLTNKNYPIVISELSSGDEFMAETQFSDANKLRVDLSNSISEAGQYSIKSNDKIVAPLSFNFNRNESDLRYYSSEELQSDLSKFGFSNITLIDDLKAEFSEVFDELQNGKQLWKWFVLFALVFIVAEALIIRLWKS